MKMLLIDSRGVHGNGNEWIPMGPMGIPWEWERLTNISWEWEWDGGSWEWEYGTWNGKLIAMTKMQRVEKVVASYWRLA